MSSFGRSFDNALDRHITGNYGEDQFKGFCLECSCQLHTGDLKRIDLEGSKGFLCDSCSEYLKIKNR